MPNYKGHVLGGMVVYGVLFCAVASILHPSFITACEWLLFTLAGALFPDIDIKSKGQKYFYYLIFVLLAVLAVHQQFATIACCSFIVITPMLVRHRGIFHRSWFIIAMPIVAWALASFSFPSFSASLFVNTLFFIAGGLSHIALDMGFIRMMSHLLSRRLLSHRRNPGKSNYRFRRR
jgi:hypothetical protein